MGSTWRRVVWLSLGGSALLGLVCVAGVIRLNRDLEAEIQIRRGFVGSVSGSPESTQDDCIEHSVTLRSTSGLEVELAIKRPIDAIESDRPTRRPLALLIGGFDTGRKAIDLVPEVRGVAIAAISYPYRGPKKPKGLAFLGAIPEIQDGIRDTPAALLLALDWLAGQPWVDPRQIELVGVSLGAPFACVAGALDDRFARVWSVHGAGNPRALIEYSLRRKLSILPVRSGVASLASLLAYGEGIAPEHWVARIAPRPFVMVNASDDERLPRTAILELYENAREPKEIHWTDGRHVEPDRGAVVARLIDLVLARMVGEEPR